MPFTLLINIFSENKLFATTSNIIHPESPSDLVAVLTFRLSYRWFGFNIKKSPRRLKSSGALVPEAGVEPARYRYHWILSPARLPIPSFRHGVLYCIKLNIRLCQAAYFHTDSQADPHIIYQRVGNYKSFFKISFRLVLFGTVVVFADFLLTTAKLDEDRTPSPVSAVFRSFRFFFLMDPGLSAPNKTGTCPLTI